MKIMMQRLVLILGICAPSAAQAVEGPVRIGDAFDQDLNRSLHRSCVSISMPDGSDPYQFLRPNRNSSQVFYDLSAQDLLNKLDVGITAAFTFGSVAIDGSFSYAADMGKDEQSETVTIVSHSLDGLLKLKRGAVISLNDLGERVSRLPSGSAQQRELCGQELVKGLELSRGFVATLKISYAEKDDLLDLDGHLNIDLKKISVAGEFYYKLRERAKNGQISLAVQAWGADTSQLTQLLSQDFFSCNKDRWNNQISTDEQSAACTRAIAQLINGGRAFLKKDSPSSDAREQASQYRVEQVLTSSYRWTPEGLGATDRMNIAISLQSLEQDSLHVLEKKALAKKLLSAPQYMPAQKKAGLMALIKDVDAIIQLADAALQSCRSLGATAFRCQDAQIGVRKAVDSFLAKIPKDLLQSRSEGFGDFCQRLAMDRALFAPDVADPGRLPGVTRDTLTTLIDTYHLSATGKAVSELKSFELQCLIVESKALQLNAIQWPNPRQLIDMRVLTSLRQLQGLTLDSELIVDKDLELINRLAGLRRLSLMRARVTRLTALMQLSALEELNLGDSALTQIASLSGHPRLKRLDLSGSQVLELNALLPALEELNIEGTRPRDLLAFLDKHAGAHLRKVRLDSSLADTYAASGLRCNENYGSIAIVCPGEQQ